MPPCRDCNIVHRTGLDALVCTYRTGGIDQLRTVMRQTGVRADVADATVALVVAQSCARSVPPPPARQRRPYADW